MRSIHHPLRRLTRYQSTISCPPKDAVSYEPNQETHLTYFQQFGPTKMMEFYQNLYKIDDIVRVKFPFQQDIIFVFDPLEMKKVHEASGPAPIGSTVSLWPFMHFYHKKQQKYKGIPMAFTTNSEEWKKLRHALQKGLFGYQEAAMYVPMFRDIIDEAVREVPKYNGKCISSFINRLTFEIIHSVILGDRANVLDENKASKENLKFVEATYLVQETGGILMNSPFARNIMTEDYTNIPDKSVIDLWNTFCESSNTILEIGMKKVLNVKSNDCLVSKYQQDGNLSQDEILLNCAGLLQGGVDTTANTVLWCLTRLAENPKHQNLIREEIQKLGVVLTGDSLTSLKLLSSFIDETMRLLPTASGHSRITINDCIVTSKRFGKDHFIPKNSRVVFVSQPMSNDPLYVKNPNEFDLYRFTRECRHARRGTNESLIDHPISDVFSFGPRMCLGARLAKLELLAILSGFVSQYSVSFDQNIRPVYFPKNNLLLRPEPMPKFTFTKVV